jgi:hypothetical protein
VRKFAVALALLVSTVFVAVLVAATDTRVPTGSVSSVWLVGAGSDRVDAVDDPVGSPDEDTTYVVDDVGGQRQRWTFSAFTVAGGSTINSVAVTGRCRYTGTAGEVILGMRNESDTGTSEDFPADYSTLTTSYTNYTRTFTTNPWAGGAWTVNQVNSEGSTANRLANMSLRTGGLTASAVRCTSVYLTVDFTAAGGGGTSHRMMTLGVGP